MLSRAKTGGQTEIKKQPMRSLPSPPATSSGLDWKLGRCRNGFSALSLNLFPRGDGTHEVYRNLSSRLSRIITLAAKARRRSDRGGRTCSQPAPLDDRATVARTLLDERLGELRVRLICRR